MVKSKDVDYPFRSAYSPKPRVSLGDFEPTLTKQAFKDECDINNIMRKYQTTGLVSHFAKGEPKYGDFSNSVDYHEAMNQVLAAQDAFMALPSSIRARFSNDPGYLLDFVSDPNNRDEAVRLGLIDHVPEVVKGDTGDVERPPQS